MPKRKRKRRVLRSHEFDPEILEEMASAEFPGVSFTTEVRGATRRDIEREIGVHRGTVEGWITRGEFPVPIGCRHNVNGGARSWVYPGKILTWLDAALAARPRGHPLYLRDHVPPRERKKFEWPPLFTKGGRMLRPQSLGYKMRLGVTGLHAGKPVGQTNLARSLLWVAR